MVRCRTAGCTPTLPERGPFSPAQGRQAWTARARRRPAPLARCDGGVTKLRRSRGNPRGSRRGSALGTPDRARRRRPGQPAVAQRKAPLKTGIARSTIWSLAVSEIRSQPGSPRRPPATRTTRTPGPEPARRRRRRRRGWASGPARRRSRWAKRSRSRGPTGPPPPASRRRCRAAMSTLAVQQTWSGFRSSEPCPGSAHRQGWRRIHIVGKTRRHVAGQDLLDGVIPTGSTHGPPSRVSPAT